MTTEVRFVDQELHWVGCMTCIQDNWLLWYAFFDELKSDSRVVSIHYKWCQGHMRTVLKTCNIFLNQLEKLAGGWASWQCYSNLSSMVGLVDRGMPLKMSHTETLLLYHLRSFWMLYLQKSSYWPHNNSSTMKGTRWIPLKR